MCETLALILLIVIVPVIIANTRAISELKGRIEELEKLLWQRMIKDEVETA